MQSLEQQQQAFPEQAASLPQEESQNRGLTAEEQAELDARRKDLEERKRIDAEENPTTTVYESKSENIKILDGGWIHLLNKKRKRVEGAEEEEEVVCGGVSILYWWENGVSYDLFSLRI